MTKFWAYSRLFWIGIVGFIGYGADAILVYVQSNEFFGCSARSALSSFVFLLVSYLRLKTNTGLTKTKGLE